MREALMEDFIEAALLIRDGEPVPVDIEARLIEGGINPQDIYAVFDDSEYVGTGFQIVDGEDL